MEQTMKGYLFRLLNHEELSKPRRALPRGDEDNTYWHNPQ